MDSSLFLKVFPLLVTLVLAMLIPAVMMGLSRLLGPRTNSQVKLGPYECGIQTNGQVGDARHRFNVKFYLTAMFFLVFDVEVLFLFPWAIWFHQNLAQGFIAMVVFLAVLMFGWFYLLRRGALEWE